MKIAVPTKENNRIDDHFGHCEYYKVFNISDNNEIIGEQIVESPQGCGCKSNIAFDLSELGVKIMLAGGIGEGAINKLSNHNIQVIRNCKGDVNELVSEYLNGKVIDGGTNCASHSNDHSEEGHICSHN